MYNLFYLVTHMIRNSRRPIALKLHQSSKGKEIIAIKLLYHLSIFSYAFKLEECFLPNHDYGVTETGYMADKAGSKAPAAREYSTLGSCSKHVELTCTGLLTDGNCLGTCDNQTKLPFFVSKRLLRRDCFVPGDETKTCLQTIPP